MVRMDGKRQLCNSNPIIHFDVNIQYGNPRTSSLLTKNSAKLNHLSAKCINLSFKQRVVDRQRHSPHNCQFI